MKSRASNRDLLASVAFLLHIEVSNGVSASKLLPSQRPGYPNPDRALQMWSAPSREVLHSRESPDTVLTHLQRTTTHSRPRLTAHFQILHTGKWLSRWIVCSKRTNPEHASRIPKMTADSLSLLSTASNAASRKQGVCPSPIRFTQGAQPPLSPGLKPSFPHQNQFCQMSDAPSQENCLNGATPQPEGIQHCRAFLPHQQPSLSSISTIIPQATFAKQGPSLQPEGCAL